MADVGKEITTSPFKLVHLGHITRHHQPLLLAIGHNANLKVTTIVQHQIVRASKFTFFQIQREFGVTQKV
ncbi:hypothetical protein D3C78_1621320 [compost metagenome]